MEKEQDKNGDSRDASKNETDTELLRLDEAQSQLEACEKGTAANSPPDLEAGAVLPEEPPEPPYTIFKHGEKVAIIILVSFTAIISPLSGSIYLPALPSIAEDLNVSISLVNLTVTTYLVRCNRCSVLCFSMYWWTYTISRRSSRVLRPLLLATSPTRMAAGQPT
jgi:hypothetical protein